MDIDVVWTHGVLEVELNNNVAIEIGKIYVKNLFNVRKSTCKKVL